MSVESKLNKYIAEFKENVEQLDAITQTVASSKSRTAMEFKKNLAILEKFNLPPEKFQMAFDTVQEIVNICLNFSPPRKMESTVDVSMVAADVADTEKDFELFRATMTERVARIEKEIGKLDALKEYLLKIKSEKETDKSPAVNSFPNNY